MPEHMIGTLTKVKMRVKNATMCQWVLTCTNKATTTIPHPVLGDVAACQSCADRNERLK